MHHVPRLDYCGLTIILSQPSRFDKLELLSGNAGAWFSEKCLRPEVNKFQCDIWSVDSFIRADYKYREGTKVVLLLGDRAMKSLAGVEVTLGEQRGSPIRRGDGIVIIVSYLPQDAFDFKDYESYLNPHLIEKPNDEDDILVNDGGEDDYGTEKTRHGKTSRKNFRFWLLRDTKKALRILKHGLMQHIEPVYKIFPNSQEIIDELNKYENTDMYLDIETDSDLNITCFGFSFGAQPEVYVVPVLRYNYSIAYGIMGAIFYSLGKAMDKNTVVCHNGSGFDFFVIPYKYGISCGSHLYDTMIATHRCFPEVEKSLGHAISNFTDLPYHKDEGIFEPQNETQEQKLWLYNGKDVSSMREVKRGIDRYASNIAGLSASICQANASIEPYLTTTLQGIRYDEQKVQEILAYNDRKLTVLIDTISTLLGPELLTIIQGKSKKCMAGSSKQCARYFHDIMRYKVVSRSKETGAPKLDEKALLKLKLLHSNPIIDLVLAYRGIAKESGSLQFNPWSGIMRYENRTNSS